MDTPTLVPADTAWMLVSTALVLLMTPALGVLLRRPGPLEERAQHDDDERRRARLRGRRLGRSLGYSPRLRRGLGVHRRPLAGLPRAASASSRRARSPTSSSWPTRARSRSSPPRWSRARSSSGCASAPTSLFITLWSLVVYAPVAHWVWGGGLLREHGRARLRGRHGRPRQRRGRGARGRGRDRRSARTTRGRRSCPTTCPSRCSAPGSSGSGGSASTRAAPSPPTASPRSRSSNTMLAPAATLVVWTLLDLLRNAQGHRGRRRHRDRGRPRGDHAGRRLRRARCSAIVLGAVAAVPELLRARSGARARGSTTRSTWSPRTASAAPWARSSPACFAEKAWNGTVGRPALRQPRPARHPGDRRSSPRSPTAGSRATCCSRSSAS